jgi:hypothetical protein
VAIDGVSEIINGMTNTGMLHVADQFLEREIAIEL